MKKLISMILAMVMCLSLVACGGPDKQPAIDAFNDCSDTFNQFAEIANADIDAFTDEEIEFFNACADLLNEYADKLETKNDFTQEEIDEMVDMFKEFDAVLEEYLLEP